MTNTLDPHGRPLGGQLERDGRLLAAAAGVDLTGGSVDNATREYWYGRARDAYEQLRGYGRAADGEESASFHRDEAIFWRNRAEGLLAPIQQLAAVARKALVCDVPPQPPVGTQFVHQRTGKVEWHRSEDGNWRCGPGGARPDHGTHQPCRNCPVDWEDVYELLAGREPKYVVRVLPGDKVEPMWQHLPDGSGACSSCGLDSYDEPFRWPCDTARAAFGDAAQAVMHDGRIVAPGACGACGIEKQRHATQAAGPEYGGLHTHIEPTDAQRRLRMLARRAQRLDQVSAR